MAVLFCHQQELAFNDTKVNRRRRMTSVFSTVFAKSSFPFLKEYFAKSVPHLPTVYR